MPVAQLADQVLVALLGEGPHCRPLDDGAELVGRFGQLKPGLDELDAGARMDGEDPLDLERPQRIAQRRHRDAEQLHQIVLRHARAGRQTAREQEFEDPAIGHLAQRDSTAVALAVPALPRCSDTGVLQLGPI